MPHSIDDSLLASLLRDRPSGAHKVSVGTALLVAGSEGMMGAALLAARACLRSGVGLLTVHSPRCGRDVLQLGCPEAKCAIDSCETHLTFDGTDLASDAVVERFEHDYDAIAIGPGLGQHRATAQAVRQFVATMPFPMVIDADALNIMATELSDNDGSAAFPTHSILTPHPGEADRLLRGARLIPSQAQCHRSGLTIDVSDTERLAATRRFAQLFDVIVVLKGEHTHVCLPDGAVWVNNCHGHAGMATGGSGDTLTGIILALLAQHYPPREAALLGVGLHSLAADLALADTSSPAQSVESWLPSDLTTHIGAALRHLHQLRMQHRQQ